MLDYQIEQLKYLIEQYNKRVQPGFRAKIIQYTDKSTVIFDFIGDGSALTYWIEEDFTLNYLINLFTKRIDKALSQE